MSVTVERINVVLRSDPNGPPESYNAKPNTTELDSTCLSFVTLDGWSTYIPLDVIKEIQGKTIELDNEDD